MTGLFDTTVDQLPLESMTANELLLLVADDDLGYKSEAIDQLLTMEFSELYPVLERCVRDDENADLRNSAMELLVKSGKTALPKLIKLLRDANEEVRNFATVMLGDIGNREAVGPLVRALSDPDANVSHGAAEALGKIGDRAALLPLLELLKGDFWLQYAAISAIGAMQDARAVPHLLELLENEMLAGSVIEALGNIGDPRALYQLCKLLATADNTLAGQTARSLVNICRTVNETLKYKNSLTALNQASQLRQHIDDAGINRLQTLLSRNGDSLTVEAVTTLLGWIGNTAALDAMFDLLDNPDYMPAVESAIIAIGKPAGPRLLSALTHPTDNVKVTAIRSLRWLGEAASSDTLQLLANNPNISVQIEALESLLDCPDEALLPALYRLSMHENPEISSRAAAILGKFPPSHVLPFLTPILGSGDQVKKCRATVVLGFLQDDDVIDTISMLAQDPAPSVRCAALRTIGLQRIRAALPLLRQGLSDPDLGVRETAISALAEFGTPEYTEDLLALLNHDHEHLDFAIIRTIGMTGADTAGPALIAYLQKGTVSRNLEFAAISTLGMIKYTAAANLIASGYLHHADPDIRRLAIETLGIFADQNSLAEVKETLHDPHWSVRVAALQVLGQMGGDEALPLIIAAMEDNDYLVRKKAIMVLGEARNISSIPALIHKLIDNEMSRFAFESLLKFGFKLAPWLHAQLERNHPTDLRIRIIDLIGKIASQKSVGPLLKLLDDASPAIRLAAIDSLAFCYDSMPMKKLARIELSDSNDDVRERAGLALRTIMMEKYF
jgi:HEAT repeat protein